MSQNISMASTAACRKNMATTDIEDLEGEEDDFKECGGLTSAHHHMNALNRHHSLKIRSIGERGSSRDSNTPAGIVNSMGSGRGKTSGRNNTLINKSANSFTSKVSPRTSHDFTEIMGYKNIDMSRDVDQSYMLKGSSNTNKKTNTTSSRNGSKGGDLSILKEQSSISSQRQ